MSDKLREALKFARESIWSGCDATSALVKIDTALAQPQNDAEAVAWRYRYELKEDSWGTWTVQKNKPNWFEPTMTDVQVEPLFTAPPSPELERMRKALVVTLASLAAAVSLLERAPKSKKAAPSDKMFDQMLADYKKALENGRKEALRSGDNHASGGLPPIDETLHTPEVITSLQKRAMEIDNHASDGKESEGGPLNWQLSDDTKARIAEIDANRRNAAINASNIVAGGESAAPSDPTPAQERREEIARIIDPVAYTGMGFLVKARMKLAHHKADRILALPPAPKGEPSQEWKPIETAPKDMTEIIVVCGPKDVRLGWYFAPSSTTFGWLDQRQRPIKPTHWMPFPALRREPEGER